MQDPSDSVESPEPEAGPDGAEGAAEDGAGFEATRASTVLAEVVPGVAAVFGEVPAELKPYLLDVGLVPAADRTRIAGVLASIGNSATVARALGPALTGAQGLYRVSGATQSLLNAGATLAVKDGANLGAVMFQGRIIAQARWVPANAVSVAQTVATIGPALATLALQMQLNEVTGLVRTNIALTSQVLATIRKDQWHELTGLVDSVDRTVDQARTAGAVPLSLWQKVAGHEALLLKQLPLYRQNVRDHIAQIDGADDPRRRRAYLQGNAEAIAFDAHALLSTLKAWIGYQSLHAARARAAAAEDAGEARLVEDIAERTGKELDVALAETTRLLDSLRRELRVIAHLPGRDSLPLLGRRGDALAARRVSAGLLEAIEPLADALRPPAPPLEAPDVVCAPPSFDPEPYLRVLRWFLEEDETLRVLAFPEQPDAGDPFSAMLGGAKELLASARDRTAATKTMVAVTDRRVVTARAGAFLDEGEIRQDLPLDQVRYVRATTPPDRDKGGRPAVDLITRDENVRWFFHSDVDTAGVDALAAVLAESMAIPDGERQALLRRSHRRALETAEAG
ncbi:hypothetical protein ABH931_002585 [Streptacidiphilus sp. MAP12-33]|uniref:hypothetical protein n=1 Tax=Streptacidiphilus sp. MAP12-33 TaxID=3156266 RepID=UPI003518F563